LSLQAVAGRSGLEVFGLDVLLGDPKAASTSRESTIVPEPGSSIDTRLPLRSATDLMLASLRATMWTVLGVERRDDAQVLDLGLALVEAGAGVGQ
jgi:hypothetical protein